MRAWRWWQAPGHYRSPSRPRWDDFSGAANNGAERSATEAIEDGDERLALDRLREVVVHARGQALLAVLAHGRGGERDDRQPPPLRVLVAEDTAVNLKVAVRMLAKLGARADTAGNGKEALEALARVPYDVVLMDVQLPEMDGFEATAELRRIEADTGRHTPVIAMTAHAMQGDRDRCLAAGMDDYLTKPIRPQSLAVTLLCWSVGRDEVVAPVPPPIDDDVEFDDVQFTEACSGDAEFGRALLQEYLASVPELLTKAREAEAAGDLTRLEAVAHTLAGGSSMLGARQLARTCEALRQHAEAGDRAAAHRALARAEQDLESLRARFEVDTTAKAA